MSTGEKIYTLRNQRGLSQEELAASLGVSRQSISKWETGQATPEIDKLIKLSDIFQISIDQLVKEDESSFSQTPPPVTSPGIRFEQKAVGFVLITTGLLLVILALFLNPVMLLFGVAVFLIGIEVVFVRRFLPLVTLWTLLFYSALIFNPWTTGVRLIWIIEAFRTGNFYAGTIIAIIQRLAALILLGVTIALMIRHKKRPRS